MTAAIAALALLLAWDMTGLDLVMAGWFGNAQGFALRDNWWTSKLLHDDGRLLAWVLLAAMLLQLWRAPATATSTTMAGGSKPTRRERAAWLGVMLLCATLVPLLKRFSSTSCPWDLAVFGGAARYVSHWQLGLADGGGGHCFPSGHAVAAFAFFGMYFLWLPHSRSRARLWLAGVLVAGAVFGAAQLVRGAHYPSHTLWSAWLCWALCVAARNTFARQVRAQASPPPMAAKPAAGPAGGSTIPAAAAGAPDDRPDHAPGASDGATRPLET